MITEQERKQALAEDEEYAYKKRVDELEHTMEIKIPLTLCDDGTYLPDPNDCEGNYLTVSVTGEIRICAYTPFFGFFNEKRAYEDIFGYVKLTRFNPFKVGAKNV